MGVPAPRLPHRLGVAWGLGPNQPPESCPIIPAVNRYHGWWQSYGLPNCHWVAGMIAKRLSCTPFAP